MEFNRSSTTVRTNSTDSMGQIYNNNYNKCSLQGPVIKVVDSDTGGSGELYECQCGYDIDALPRQRKRSASPPNKIVTYSRQIGTDKMLVVKQEMEAPIVTPWLVFHMFMFLFFLILGFTVIKNLSFTISKADEIMAVSALLLFILVKCRPRYFLPFMIFQFMTGGDRQREGINKEGYENEQ